MKGLYVAPIDLESKYYIGVKNKISAQIKAFNKLNFKVDLLCIRGKNIYLNEENIGIISAGEDFFYVINKFNGKGYDFIYLRYIYGNLNLLKKVKEFNKNISKIVLEIPTYPYMQEFPNNIDKVKLFIKDVIVSRNLKKYISFITTTNEYKKIWGIRTIEIRNGIDIDNLPLTKRIKNNNSLNMVGLANLNRWHGYDRVIEGLNNYYKTKHENDINFYIIGEGKEKENLQNMVKEYGLKNRVYFLGALKGDKLNDQMNNMDIGVSSLALHRAGGGHDPIKTKEFIGRGMPVIAGYEDKLVDMSLEFVLKVPEDETPVNLEEICNKFINIKSDKEHIRDYAKNNLSWDYQVSKIVKKLNR